jgi:hypothetical protein
MDSEKADLASKHCLVWNYLDKKEEFNLRNYLVFLDYVHALTDKFFNITQQKYY